MKEISIFNDEYHENWHQIQFFMVKVFLLANILITPPLLKMKT